MMTRTLCLPLLAVLVAPAAFADTTVTVEPVTCLEVEDNRPVVARVAGDVPGSSVRLYFRRLNDIVEDFYWLQMQATGDGSYWGVLPRPADRELPAFQLREDRPEVEEHKRALRERGESDDVDRYRQALWWRVKELSEDRNPNRDLDQERIAERSSVGRREQRDWMAAMSDRELEAWLDSLVNEPAEYFVAVYDPRGQRLAESAMQVVKVNRRGCDEPELTEAQAGYADNLVVGETAGWQAGEEVFHWLCEGVVTRIDESGVWRADDRCRACVIAWWQKSSFLIPTAATLVGTGVILIDDDEPREASPSRP